MKTYEDFKIVSSEDMLVWEIEELEISQLFI